MLCSDAGTLDTLPDTLRAVTDEIGSLSKVWARLSVQQRKNVLEGVPEAQALVNAGEGGEGGVAVVYRLLLAPVAWCYKVSSCFA